MSFLLDTDTCSFHLKRPSGLMHRFVQHSGRLYIPRCPRRRWLALGEQLHGANLQRNLAPREMYENLRDDSSAKIILVQPTRDDDNSSSRSGSSPSPGTGSAIAVFLTKDYILAGLW